MNKAGVRWLYQELPELVEKNILSSECADKLQQHYGPVKNAAKTNAMLVILGTLGSLLIGLGIILLLAHNWEQFSCFTRTVLSFAPLVLAQAVAFWVLRKKPDSGAFKEGAATFWALMVGASMSLIGQTYNITTDPGSFTLAWMLLILPITYLMQATLPAVFYLAGITVWSGIYFIEPLKNILFWPLAAAILPHFIWAIRRKEYAIRSAILSFAAVICVNSGASISLGKTWPGSWVIISPSLYSIFYSLGSLKTNAATQNWQAPLRILGAIGLFFLAFFFTFRFSWEQLSHMLVYGADITDIRYLPDHLIVMAIVVTAVLLCYRHIKNKNLTAALFSGVPILTIYAYLLRSQMVFLPLLIFNVYLFILSINQMRNGIRSNNVSLTNIGMLMLAILIIARFFDSDISFVLKGLAFIAVGVGFLMVNLRLSRAARSAK